MENKESFYWEYGKDFLRIIFFGIALAILGEIFLYAYFARHGIYPFERYDIGLLSLLPLSLTLTGSIILNALVTWGWIYLYAAKLNGANPSRYYWILVSILNEGYSIW